jgi:putative SOS response-associated peptidase YedK
MKRFRSAGVWDGWKDPESGEWVRSCAIITGPANDRVEFVHDRMPVMLPRERWEEWLDPENEDVEALQGLLVPAPAELVTLYPVSTRVNTPRNNAPENLDRDPDAPAPPA